MDREAYLPAIVPKLFALKRDESATIFYDVMSDSLIWSDEKLSDLPVEEMGCLRALFRFRTSILAGQPESRFEGLWQQLQRMCPTWIGFHPTRCQPSDELRRQYNERKSKADRDINRLP